MGFFGDLVKRILGGGRASAPPSTPAPAPPQPPLPARPAPPTRPQPPAQVAPPFGTSVIDTSTVGHSPEPKPPAVDAYRLGGSRYEPISRQQILSQADSLGGWMFSNLLLNRRDRIPAADDLRTNLIDRGMVTNGFLTPEEIAEIHQVGDEMDRARTQRDQTRARASFAGQSAVEADREERARIKAERKAEAAERKRQSAEAVAHRRANEIIYLGRGVSRLLGDHQSNLQALQSAGLPELSTPAELAEALGISVSKLRWLSFHADVATRVHYVSFEVAKRSGGTRRLSAPHRSLALAQRWIFNRILSQIPCEPEAQGFVTGRSILTNAQPHAGHDVVINLDLKDFFPSVGFRRVRSVFRRVGYSPSVATILALLCTECPRRKVVYDEVTYHVATGPRGLPQGASTSPSLSNLVARRLDRRLAGLARKLGATYTRYADDITFSGNAPLNDKVGYLMARVRHLAEAEGFTINESKSRVLRQNTAQMVTGLVVNDRPGVARDEVRRLRAILHRAQREGLDAQNRDNQPNFRAWLRGKIAFVQMARPEAGVLLLAQYDRLST